MDNPHHTSTTVDRADLMSVPPQSLQIGSEKTQETGQQLTKYPKQTLLHQLKSEYLTPGEDGFYYKIRDYNLNETDLLGSGEFGSCLWAQDLTTEKMFAIKQNKNECFKSIEDECLVLSHLAENDHIIRFLGAVVDEMELPTEPNLVCKMMMELAENGNLSEMLRDEDGLEAPLPDDQSLYYLQQILEGVNFLHQNGYLHLDIKAQNILVFDGGRTVKLTDFGSAVSVGDAPRGLKGCTPYFAAPEIIKGEVPTFSADIWSVLCILVEVLTARWLGCHQVVRNEMAIMYLIGSYEDHMINDLIPLNTLNVEPEVKQLFIDVFHKDPTLRPSAVELLNRPVIRSAVEYGCYFDECYDSEDAEELEPLSTTDIPIAEVPQQISLTSSSGQVSFHFIGDEVSELPQFPCNQQLNRGSQDSGVEGDLESSIGSSAMFGSQMSMRSSSSGNNKSNTSRMSMKTGSGSSNQQKNLYQDSGMEDMSQPVYINIPVHHVDVPISRQHSSSLNKFNSLPNLNFSSHAQGSRLVAGHDCTMTQRSYSHGGQPLTKQSATFQFLSRDSKQTDSGDFLTKRLRDLSTELSLLVTNSEQYFSWHEFGLNLHIPENSLPEGVQQCSIFIRPRVMGEYQLPKDSHLVSAVYSIKCVPKCQFTEPVTLEIQHCAKPENIQKLSFIRAIRSTSEKKAAQFHIIEIGEDSQTDGIFYSSFPYHTSYGFVELSKFCQFGVIQRDTDERDYCANVYYREDSARQHKVYFTILWNTNTHNKAVCEHYQKENAVQEIDQPVEFEDNQIKLDIPFPPPKGITSDDKAWRILSLTPPVITKKEVDSFEEGKRIPSCQLVAKCDTKQLTDLVQSVGLKGAREPYDTFMIHIAAASHKSLTVGKRDGSKHQPRHTECAHTTHPSLSELLLELRVITDPLLLGIFLDIEPHILREIEKDHRQIAEQRTAMITHWQNNCRECSWGALADAVDKMEKHTNLVKKLRELDSSRIQRMAASEQACVAPEPPTDPEYKPGSMECRCDRMNTEMSFTVLIKELSSKVSEDWEDIGLFLELQQGALDEIRGKFPSHTKKCFREMIKLWLRQVDPLPTWSAIIDAIDELEHESLAQELRDKFL